MSSFFFLSIQMSVQYCVILLIIVLYFVVKRARKKASMASSIRSSCCILIEKVIYVITSRNVSDKPADILKSSITSMKHSKLNSKILKHLFCTIQCANNFQIIIKIKLIEIWPSNVTDKVLASWIYFYIDKVSFTSSRNWSTMSWRNKKSGVYE